MTRDLWHVYLLESSNGNFYCGITNNLFRRLREHNGVLKGGAKYTRQGRPFILRACLPCRDRSSAQKLEARIKTMPKSGKMVFFGDCVNAGS